MVPILNIAWHFTIYIPYFISPLDISHAYTSTSVLSIGINYVEEAIVYKNENKGMFYKLFFNKYSLPSSFSPSGWSLFSWSTDIRHIIFSGQRDMGKSDDMPTPRWSFQKHSTFLLALFCSCILLWEEHTQKHASWPWALEERYNELTWTCPLTWSRADLQSCEQEINLYIH